MKKKIRMNKMFSVLLALTLLVSALTVPASAVSNSTIDNILFDATYYAEHNPDVVNALGRSTSALRNHYLSYGKKEGRAPSDLYNPSFYLNLYPDLKAAFGSDYTAAYNHFVTCGISEGRQGSATFSVQAYKANYADLRNAFGTSSSNNWKYLQHWVQYGRSENRNATTSLNNTTSTASTASTASTTKYVRTSGGNLNMRSGAGTGYSVVAKLANGTAVTVYSTSNGWAKVSANGKTGYVSTQYLNSTKPSSDTNTSTNTTASSGWQMPMANAYCTWSSYSNMSWASYTKNSSGRNYHLGIDIYGTNGTVYAAASGTVVAVSSSANGANGRYIIIQHTINGKAVYSFYAHLSTVNVSKGQAVTAGMKIAIAGGSGYGKNAYYGTHLHFAIVDTLWSSGGYYGYSTSFSGNKTTFKDVTYFNPIYVINNNGKLP